MVLGVDFKINVYVAQVGFAGCSFNLGRFKERAVRCRTCFVERSAQTGKRYASRRREPIIIGASFPRSGDVALLEHWHYRVVSGVELFCYDMLSVLVQTIYRSQY